MSHSWEIKQNKAGEFVAYYMYGPEAIFWTEGYADRTSAQSAIESILANGANAVRNDRAIPELEKLQEVIDSTDWTGLGKAITHEKAVVVRQRTNALLEAIIQSDGDIGTRTDACKRVEAAIVLLEAPNVPWREVVNLLNHPSVTAFLAALSLIQFILGMA